MPRASRDSFVSAWSCANCWKSRTEIAAVKTPASTIPPTKTSGKRTRSEPNISTYVFAVSLCASLAGETL